MFFKLVIAALARRRSRKLLAAASVWIGITPVIAFLALSVDVGDKLNLELRSFGANIKVEPVDAAIPVRIGGQDIAPERADAHLREEDLAKLKTIFWRNNILAISPRLLVPATVGSTKAPLLGVWFDHRIPVPGGDPFVTGARQVYPHWEVVGSWPAAGPDSVVRCLVGRELSQRLGIGVGDRLEIKTEHADGVLEVSGVVTTGGREDGAVIAPLAAVQTLTGLTGKVAEADVSALTTPENHLAEKYRKDPKALTVTEYERWTCTPYPGSVAADVQKAIPGAAARVVRRVSETQGTVLRHIQGLLSLLSIWTLLVSCLTVTGVLSAAVLDRRREMALMRAIGANRWNVVLLFLSESALLGLVGGVLSAGTGSLLGVWLVRLVFGGQADFHAVLLILAPLLGLGVAWAGSLVPVWRAFDQSTADQLRGGS